MKFNFGKEKKDLAKIEELERDLNRANLRIQDLKDELSALNTQPGDLKRANALIQDLRDEVAALNPPYVRLNITADDAEAVKEMLKVKGAMEGIQTVIFKQDPHKPGEAGRAYPSIKPGMTRRY